MPANVSAPVKLYPATPYPGPVAAIVPMPLRVADPPPEVVDRCVELTRPQSTAVAPRRVADLVPKRSPALFLDAHEHDDLVTQLENELRPPNELARQTVRLLAQEISKLQFLQRVEFAVMDRSQHVDEQEWQQMEEIRISRARGKTSAQCRNELRALRALCSAVCGNRGEPLTIPVQDVGMLAPTMWNRITFWERQWRQQAEEIDDIDVDMKTADDEERVRLAEARLEAERLQSEAEEEARKGGRADHGIETLDDVARILTGERPIPAGTRNAWAASINVEIEMVADEERCAVRYEERLSAMRTTVAEQATYALACMGPVRQHSATVWKNIDRCMKRLASLGVDIRRAPPALSPGARESGYAR